MPDEPTVMTARQQEILAAFRDWIEATEEGEKVMEAVQSAVPSGRVTLDFVGATFATFGLMTLSRAIRSALAGASDAERAAVYDDWMRVVGYLGRHFDERHARGETRLDPKQAN